jgi:DNA repair protein RadC
VVGMKIYEIPRYNRPGVRLQRMGADHLSDAELLAIVLGRGNKNENAIDMSHRILRMHNLDKLANLDLTELKTIVDTDVKALKIAAMFELFRRTNRLHKNGFKQRIKNAQDVYNQVSDELIPLKQEHFLALYLDTKNQIIKKQVVSKGTLNASLVHPREVFNPAVKASANSIILVHNHPSGDPTPSKEDETVTKNLVDAGELLGISVLDHVVIGDDEFVSLREKGIM